MVNIKVIPVPRGTSPSQRPPPEWDKKMASGLRKECETLTGITEDFPTQSIYATHANTFVGGLIMEQHGDILWIDNLWVEPELRNQGIAAQLIDRAYEFAAHEGIREIQLNTFFEKAYLFFLSYGFEEVAIVPNWKYDLKCYLMRKMVKSG